MLEGRFQMILITATYIKGCDLDRGSNGSWPIPGELRTRSARQGVCWDLGVRCQLGFVRDGWPELAKTAARGPAGSGRAANRARPPATSVGGGPKQFG
jgi:hypothetical protein